MIHVEMIEEYILDGADYQYFDNHGTLIRCRDCRYYEPTDSKYGICVQSNTNRKLMKENGYCSKAKKR